MFLLRRVDASSMTRAGGVLSQRAGLVTDACPTLLLLGNFLFLLGDFSPGLFLRMGEGQDRHQTKTRVSLQRGGSHVPCM